MLPAIGTDDFRQLEFKAQLEIVSLRLFHEEDYEREVGIPPKPLVEVELDYPPGVTEQPQIGIDLPVAFAEHHWAAYSCAFKPQWYERDFDDGCNPLDDFNIGWRKLVNVFAFNFAMLSLDGPTHHLFDWVVRTRTRQVNVDSMLSACRVLLWLDLALRRPEFSESFKRWNVKKPNGFKPNPRDIYNDAQLEFVQLYDYDDINGYCPTIQTCDSLLFWEFDDYVVLPSSRPKNKRWYYPMIPSALYQADRFRVWGWDWLK
jgi:hypothetical protein